MIPPLARVFQSTLPLRGATRVSGSSRPPPIFQSTLPLRGATKTDQSSTGCAYNFNPRSPYGERPPSGYRSTLCYRISIHAPLTGSDRKNYCILQVGGISIHAPLTGSDIQLGSGPGSSYYFNPRSPYGERLNPLDGKGCKNEFQSTLPLRGATGHCLGGCFRLLISIHAPLTGSDLIPVCFDDIWGISIHAPLTGSDAG